MRAKIDRIFSHHFETFKSFREDELIQNDIEKLAKSCIAALEQGHKILFCGNGGSAADAQHIAAELSGKFYLNRKALYAEALHVNSSYMTAVSNDYGFEYSYARLVEAKGRKGDILIGLSTSGNSANVVNAFDKAKDQGMLTVAWTGKSGGKLSDKSDMIFRIPSTDTPRIQEMHILLGHILCDLIENELFPEK